MRGCLALSVMVHHFYIWTNIKYFNGTWDAPDVNFIAQMGAGAVALFFMTTGFVFYPRILNGWKSTSWITVYITRVFRILPLTLLSVILITAVIYYRAGGTFNATYAYAAAHWLSGFGEPDLLGYTDSGRINAYVLWSLWYEWVFYIAVLPLSAIAMDIVKNRRLPSWTLPVALLCLAFASRIFSKVFNHDLEFLRMLPLFGVGMLAYEIQARENLKNLLCSRMCSVIAVGCLVIAMTATRNPYGISLPLFGIFFICVAAGNNVWGLLDTRPAGVLGEISFSIYLLHGIVIDVLFVDANSWMSKLGFAEANLTLCAVSLIVVAVSSLSFLLVEKRAIAIGKAVARSWDGRKLRLSAHELDVAP
nr:acyltransferase [Novosphingobium sp. HII-3]